jgi:hypothetical protein
MKYAAGKRDVAPPAGDVVRKDAFLTSYEGSMDPLAYTFSNSKQARNQWAERTGLGQVPDEGEEEGVVI